MSKFLWLALVIAVAAIAGVFFEREHTARLASDAHALVWKDSVKVSTAKAAASEALYEATKAAYYRQPPAVVQIVKWRSRVDTVLDSLQVSSKMDSADAAAVTAIFDSLSVDCARRDSLSRDALQAATVALAQKDSALALALHPPVLPQKRVGLFAEGAYDFAQHGAVVNAGVYLSVGKVKPYVALGADIGNQATGHIQVGVRVEW